MVVADGLRRCRARRHRTDPRARRRRSLPAVPGGAGRRLHELRQGLRPDSRDADLLYRGYRTLLLRDPGDELAGGVARTGRRARRPAAAARPPRRRALPRAARDHVAARRVDGPRHGGRRRTSARHADFRRARRRSARRGVAADEGHPRGRTRPPGAARGEHRRHRRRSGDRRPRHGRSPGRTAPAGDRPGRAARLARRARRPRAGDCVRGARPRARPIWLPRRPTSSRSRCRRRRASRRRSRCSRSFARGSPRPQRRNPNRSSGSSACGRARS